MGKFQGMPSVHNLVAAIDKKWGAIVISYDKHCDTSDYPNSILIRVPKVGNRIKNRYASYAAARLNYIVINTVVIFTAIVFYKKIDFIYANTAIPAVSLVSKILRVPNIRRIYGTFLRGNLNNFWGRLKRYEEVFLFVFKAHSYIITNDGTGGDAVAAHYKISPKQVYYWRNGIDLAYSNTNYREKLNFDKDTVIFSVACRLTGWKRVDRCINAFMNVPNSNIRLVIAGAGDQELQLRELAASDSRIIFLGQIDNAECSKLIADSNVYITLHDYSNIGNPLLQALHAGIPVLTCATGDTSSVVIDGYNGVCLALGAEDYLIFNTTSAIKLLAENSEYRTYLSSNALSYARDNLKTWDERIDMEINLIESTVRKFADCSVTF